MKTPPFDRHTLYEASVQSVEENLSFLQKTFKKTNRPPPRRICEDFCGTARLAAKWVQLSADHEAVAIDLYAPVLRWGEQHHLSRMTDAQRSRIQILEENVLTAEMAPADAILAFNFSYFIFHTREALRNYFVRAKERLHNDGALVLDFYGGYDSYQDVHEARGITEKTTVDGILLPDFAYEWEQTRFNAVTHRVVCYIHFDLEEQGRIERAFRYDWRLWTLPELQEILLEAGFQDVGVYTHGWDDSGESNDKYKRRAHFANEQSWLAYLVAWK